MRVVLAPFDISGFFWIGEWPVLKLAQKLLRQ